MITERKNNSKRQRILYIERPAFLGGSVIGLYQLVCGLDTDRYEPIILFYGPNPYRQHFEDLGHKVITLSEAAPTPPATTTNTRDIAVSLERYHKCLAEGYRLAKQSYLLLRSDLPLAWRIGKLIKQYNIDLVHHNNNLPGNRATIIAAWLARVPQVCHVRMLLEFSVIDRFLARSVNAFIYMSTAIEQLYHNLGIPTDKGQVIYDAFDTDIYKQPNLPHELQSELGITNQDYVISNIGRIDWWKGQDYFLQAIAEVVQKQPQVKALIIGEPDATPATQAYYQKLQHLVKELDLSEHVIFTGFRSDIPQILAATNMVVHSSSEPEPFGRVIIEGMAAGKPVIATAAGGVLDIIEDGITGILVPPKNAASMAQAAHQLIKHQDQAKKMGQYAQKHVEERYSIDKHAAAVQQLYQRILTTST